MQFQELLNSLLFSNVMPDTFIEGCIWVIEKYGTLFIKGFLNTLILAITGTVFGLMLGLVISLIRQSTITERDGFIQKAVKKIGRFLSIVYIQYLRGTPMLVQAMIVHLIISNAGYRMESMALGIIVISVNTSAYMAEILRSSINGIDKGQLEAARALGMTQNEGMRYFVLPQAIKHAIPSIGNEFVTNAKDSSVLNVIMVAELFYQAKIIGQITYRSLEPLIIVSLIYLTITLASTYILNKIEKYMDTPKENHLSPKEHLS